MGTPTASAGPNRVNLEIRDATTGFAALLNDDLAQARVIFASKPDSVFHSLGAALITFLEATLGQEEKDLGGALELLFKTEESIKKAKHKEKEEAAGSTSARWWSAGIEYDVLVAETIVCQAIVHIMTESMVEMTKGLYKMSRAHKAFSAAYKVVFPQELEAASKGSPDVLSSDPRPLLEGLNALYSSAALHAQDPLRSLPHSNASSHWVLAGIGKRLGYGPPRTHSSPALAALAHRQHHHPSHPTAAEPTGYHTAPASGAVTPLPVDLKPKWQDDDLATLVIGATAFGNGIFGLILSVLPSKAKKLMGWVGFGGGLGRRESARVLMLAASSCRTETHGMMSGLALLSYFNMVILAAEWVADEAFVFDSYSQLVDSFSVTLPDSTLCALHRSRLFRIKGEADKAIELLTNWQKSASQRKGGMRQVDALISHEVAHLYVTTGRWKEAAEAFKDVQARSSWSHVTTTFATVGCLLNIPDRTKELDRKIGGLFAELPSLMKQKRLFGEPPPMETFVLRKLAQYKSKHDQLVAEGAVPAGREACFWDSIAISPIEEFGLLWSMWPRTPKDTLRVNVVRLASLTPVIPISGFTDPVNLSTSPARMSHLAPEQPASRDSSVSSYTSTSTAPTTPRKAGETHLFLPDELAVRDMLIGIQLVALDRFEDARACLLRVVDASHVLHHGDAYISASALAQLAVLELKEAARLDAEDAKSGRQTQARRVGLWKERTDAATRWIDAVFARSDHYNMKSRQEFKLNLLKEEISDRRAALGITS